jgi:hydrogenase maturation protein HypF
VTVAPTVALGGELKVAICVASGNHAWMSQHIGDLGDLATEQALEEIRSSFCRIYGVEPQVHAVDRHPAYRTHRLSLERHWPGRTEVQHHHAHIASVMVEHGLDGTTPVIGMAFDGTGFGTGPDGAHQIWGGEVLVADYAGFERVGHLAALPLPGGDAAVRNPCRIALAYLAALGIATDGGSAPELACDDVERAVVVRMVAGGSGCVPTTSMGRLFDAVASLIGIRHRVTYEAQAAIELEAVAGAGRPVLPVAFGLSDDGVLDPRPVLVGLARGTADGVPVADLARSFHHAVAGAVLASAHRAAATAGRLPVALGGGVFQNALLTGLVRRSLEADGFTVLTHRSVPPNDGGLALGQAVVAGYRRS